MTRIVKITKPALSLLFLLLFGGLITGLEVGTFFTIGNLSLSEEGAPAAGYPWGLTLTGSQALAESFAVQAGYSLDPTLKNLVYTIFSYKQDSFSLGVGPFFGIFNSASTIMKSGISTSVQLEWPGTAFLSFRADSSIGGRMVQTGDYIQERNDITAGYYVKNAICSFNLLNKRFSEKTATGEAINMSTEYSFKTDIFMKNIPYRVLLTFGYNTLERQILTTLTNTTDTFNLNSIILGTKVTVRITPRVYFVADLLSSVYSFGFHKQKVGSDAEQIIAQNVEDGSKYYFQLSTGVQINTDLP